MIPQPPQRIVSVCDIETYIDYSLIMFKEVDSLTVWASEAYPGKPHDRAGILAKLQTCTIVTFNGINYDMPIINAALAGYDCASLKRFSDEIIVGGIKPWEFERKYNLPRMPYLDHIDLIEVAPGMCSLKIYGGRVHSKKMQDLPIEPGASITSDMRQTLYTYCVNDLDTTIDLYKNRAAELALRQKMSKQYNVDLRSKSDAQIAEAVIKSQIGFTVERPNFPAGTRFFYTPPPYIQFNDTELNATLAMIKAAPFTINDKLVLTMSKELETAKIKIGNSTYKLGMGGLHSTEESAYHITTEQHQIGDTDVRSYYPELILNMGLAPAQMGSAFTKVYGAIVKERLAAKDAGDKVTADTLKIVVNGSFGKFGSRWSTLYSPPLLVQTTVTGQLALLMLIETFEMCGIAVVSANTDGVVTKCPKSLLWLKKQVIADWEARTGLVTESVDYAAIFSRDVNNYIAVKTDLTCKTKGAYAEPGIAKNPTGVICVDAVIAYLTKNIPVDATVRACTDIRRFLYIRQVAGGGEKDGQYLGKAVRWYYSDKSTGPITYVKNGNKVAGSDGAQPLMTLPDTLPDDIDYALYTRNAKLLLSDLGIAI